MNESVQKLIKACQRMSALGKGLTLEDWRREWVRFVDLKNMHLAAGDGLLDLEPLSSLKPGVQQS